MSNTEIERKIGSLKYRKKTEEEFFHNKVYLFNTQTMENNIKMLKNSLMQKTQFLQKHNYIDNIQKETKYKLINSKSDITKKATYSSPYIPSEIKRFELTENNQNNNNFNINFENSNNLNHSNNNKTNKNIDRNIDRNNIGNNDKNINTSNLYNKSENQNSFELNEHGKLNNQKEFIKKLEPLRKPRQTSSNRNETLEKETSFGSNKSKSTNKKRQNARFLTSLDHSNSQINSNNNDSYIANTKKKLQKFSNKIEFKSRNKFDDASPMKGNSEINSNNLTKSIGLNTLNINTGNIDGKLNFLSLNNKQYNYDIKDKLNESIIINNETIEQQYLKKLFDKNKNLDKISYINKNNRKNNSTFSKSDSEFKMQEGEILKKLNILDSKNKKNIKDENIESYKEKNILNPLNEKIKELINNSELEEKIRRKKSEDFKKTGNLQLKNKQNLSPSKQILNKNLNEIDINLTLDSLENETYGKNINLTNVSPKRKINSIKSQNNNVYENLNEYLLSNPNLITNAEINENIKNTQNKIFYNTCENLKTLNSNQALNKNTKNKSNDSSVKNNLNILINEDYNQTKNIENSIKESNQIANKEANLNPILEEHKRKISTTITNAELNRSILNHNLNGEKNREINIKAYGEKEPSFKEKKIIRNNSNFTNISQSNMNRQSSSSFKKGVIISNYPKMKITDRIALMSKGILKESYDAETEKIFQKIFTKNLENILEMKKYPIRAASTEKINIHDERHEFGKKDYLSKEITDLKEKVYFLKGTLDYIFPQFLIGKLKETQKQQQISKIKNTISKMTENNLNNFNNLFTNNPENEMQVQFTLNNSKNNINKDPAYFRVENTDKDSSNGYSKNEFLFPNINAYDKTINNNNNNNLNNSNNNYILEVNFNETRIKPSKNINFKNSSIYNNRYDLTTLNRTKLISSETNSSLFNKFNNFKNLKNNNSLNNLNMWNNSMNDMNFQNQKRFLKKQILAKTMSIQNMNSFNVCEY